MLYLTRVCQLTDSLESVCLSRFSFHQSSVLTFVRRARPGLAETENTLFSQVNSDLLSSSPVSSFNVTVLFCVCLLYTKVY